MKNVYLFQPQFAVDIRNQTNHWLPYSVGCLWSYVQQFDVIKENYVLKDLYFKRLDPDELIANMEDPVVCGFSSYVWNKNYCMALAKRIKEKWPKCHIVFGGPQSNSKLLDTGYVDTVVQAEGEISFLKILEDLHAGRQPEQIYFKDRVQDLDIPSPYLTGVFDTIIRDNPNTVWAMILETNRGCPYSCTFCDWGGTTYSKIKKFGLERIAEELDWAVKNPIVFMMVADANFGILKERDLEIAKMIRHAADRGSLETVNVQYAKNSTEVVFQIGKILGDLSKGITVSVQSMHDATLEAIKRKNMNTNNITHMLELSQEYGVGTYTDIIIPLPLETLETWKDGLGQLLEMGQHDGLDLWFCQLYDNNEMSSFESKLKYGIKSVLAHDYMMMSNPDDYLDIEEDVLLVNQTSTMNTEEIAEGYTYGQMIIHFHHGGYTQLYAKYCRNVLGIPYRDFYDRLYEMVFKNSVFKEHYTALKDSVYKYLTTGRLHDASLESVHVDNKKKGHGLGSDSGWFLYNNKLSAYQLGRACTQTFTDSTTAIDQLQTNLVYDHSVKYPMEITVPVDIKTWKLEDTTYSIQTKNIADENFNFFRQRRKGLLRNKIIKV